MDVFDAEVIVIGAVPAGRAAAIELARRGRDALLLDHARFPRDKPCGDLIDARAVELARSLGIDAAVLQPYPPLQGASIAVDGGALARAGARVVPRRTFDAALVDAAERAGARCRQAVVREVTAGRDGVRVVRGIGPDGRVELRARGIIVAGGYGCRVASDMAPHLGSDGPPCGVAMRGYWAGIDALADPIVFALDPWLLPGFGWVFPLPAGGANVGVGALVNEQSTAEPLRDLYQRFTRDRPRRRTTGCAAHPKSNGRVPGRSTSGHDGVGSSAMACWWRAKPLGSSGR